ncbi:hypothetical protein [Streptomyces dangxiongensis]|uniref:hypothetical protein n=1 Tax=Streptomyces dangxiongensis TaxID=1442032 RepID=UPI001F08CC0C|nr:hypothetical protein [Streptomyces dangxiongensis]
MESLTRLGGHTSQQTAELLDGLVALHALAGWRHDREKDEVFWQLRPRHPEMRTAQYAGAGRW